MGMLMVARTDPAKTVRGESRRFTLTGTLCAGEPSWLLTWICTEDTRPMLFDYTKEKIQDISGPHGEVEGVAWFEVLYHVLEGHHIWRLYNFNASLLCFHQIAACTGEKPEKYQPSLEVKFHSTQARGGLLNTSKTQNVDFDAFYTLIPFEITLVICSLPDLVSTEAFT